MEAERGRVDVAVVGSLNFDLTLRTARMPHPGEAVAATDFRSGPGGKGLNQAIAAARQGATAALIGCLGTDPAGDEMVAALESEGVDVAGVTRLAHVASGLASVIVTDDAENAIVVALGANASLDEEHVHRHGRIVGDAKVLLVQLEVPPDAVRAALEIARGAATLAVLNAAPPRPIADDVLRLADVVVVNEGEAAALTGDPPPPDDPGTEWAARSAAALVARGCPAAVVTLGAARRLVRRPPAERPRAAPHRRRRRLDGRGRRVLRHARRGPGRRRLPVRRTRPGVGGRRPRHDPPRIRALAPHRPRRRRAPRRSLTRFRMRARAVARSGVSRLARRRCLARTRAARPRSAMAAATSSATSTTVPSGTTRLSSPMRSPSAGSKSRAVRMSSWARAAPTRRGSR